VAVTARCPAHQLDFDPYDPDLTEPSVWSAYLRLRESGGLAYSPARDGFWLLGVFAEVKAALRDPGTFSSAHGHRVPADGTQNAIPIDFDPPLHSEYRKLMMRALSPQRVRDLQPFVRDLIADLVRAFHAADGGDFVSAVALPLPLRVLTEVVGFAPDTVERFRALTEQMWRDLTDTGFAAAARHVHALMREEIATHRRERPDDYLTWLLTAEVDGRPLRDDEITGILSSLAVAGHETTMNAASTLVHLLAENPELQQRLRTDPTRAPDFVEEMLRLRTPAQNFARRTTRDVVVGETTIPAGETVLLSFASANRDEHQFPDPDRFDIDRANRHHVAFGWGIHQCLGAALARTELKVLLETLCDYPPLRPAGPASFSDLRGGNHLGPTRLPLTFG
jgi:cytochrome P450